MPFSPSTGLIVALPARLRGIRLFSTDLHLGALHLLTVLPLLAVRTVLTVRTARTAGFRALAGHERPAPSARPPNKPSAVRNAQALRVGVWFATWRTMRLAYAFSVAWAPGIGGWLGAQLGITTRRLAVHIALWTTRATLWPSTALQNFGYPHAR